MHQNPGDLCVNRVNCCVKGGLNFAISTVIKFKMSFQFIRTMQVIISLYV